MFILYYISLLIILYSSCTPSFSALSHSPEVGAVLRSFFPMKPVPNFQTYGLGPSETPRSLSRWPWRGITLAPSRDPWHERLQYRVLPTGSHIESDSGGTQVYQPGLPPGLVNGFWASEKSLVMGKDYGVWLCWANELGECRTRWEGQHVWSTRRIRGFHIVI